MHFGEHLMVDGYGGDFQKLNDEKLVLGLISELITKLGMRQLSNPQIFRASENEYKDPGGWSGYAIIQESHISVHTFPARGFVSADVYTCKNNLDKELIVDILKHAFLLKEVETNFVLRGIKYPIENLRI